MIAKLFSGSHTAVEPNRVSSSMHGCVGGLPRRRFGQLIGRDHDAGGRRLGADEPESGECTAVGEEAAPRSQNQWVDQEHVLIDEVPPHQRLDQLSAAEYHEILAKLLLEPGHGLRGVALEERGVAPRERL